MIAPWMLYLSIVGVLFATAAYALEQVASMGGWPRRWIWLGAIVLLPVAPLATSALRPMPVARPAVSIVRTSSTLPAEAFAPAPAPASPISQVFSKVGAVVALPAEAFQQAQIRLSRIPRLDGWLLSLWVALTALLLVAYVTSLGKLAKQRRRWPQTKVDGESVLVSTDVGPAVIGTVRPAIVLPAWSLGIEPAQRALILRHEREHLRAWDPLMLQLATLTTYLVPWNLPVWWMLRRFRVAVELDCDRRVLRAGNQMAQYAGLLLDVGSRRSQKRIPAPALVDRRSLLSQRILAMCPVGRSRFKRLRILGSAALAYALLAAAYATPAPVGLSQADQASSDAQLLMDLVSWVPDTLLLDDAATMTAAEEELSRTAIASASVALPVKREVAASPSQPDSQPEAQTGSIVIVGDSGSLELNGIVAIDADLSPSPSRPEHEGPSSADLALMFSRSLVCNSGSATSRSCITITASEPGDSVAGHPTGIYRTDIYQIDQLLANAVLSINTTMMLNLVAGENPSAVVRFLVVDSLLRMQSAKPQSDATAKGGTAKSATARSVIIVPFRNRDPRTSS